MVVYGVRGENARKLAYPLLARAVQLQWGLEELPVMEWEGRGKPWFPQFPQYHFNVSHSGALAVCALSDSPVGVDIQVVKDRREGLIQRVSSPEELMWLQEQEDRAAAFAQLWAMKESRCKHSGQGLTNPISAITVPLPEGEKHTLSRDGLWFHLAAGEDWRFSLCGGPDWDGVIHWLDHKSFQIEEKEKMIRLECDYACGAHPAVMDRLVATNGEATPGYGTDDHCANAARMIRELCQAPQADVHFLVGGTQTNVTVISAALRPYQGVLSPDSGHIAVHETGAVEATGHKILIIPAVDGKITAAQVRTAIEAHLNDPTAEHTVQPAMVYISNPTELGTIYKLAELEAIREVTLEHGLCLFVDGARLGCALGAEENDITLPDLARLCDAFYIGGTKMGALFGEALVLTHPDLKRDFRYMIKRHGGMLAKGRLLGVQFEALLENGLYFQIGRHNVSLAMELKKACLAKGYPMYVDSPTNQQFPILPDSLLEKLEGKCTWSLQDKVDATHTAIRFCTSWATTREEVEQVIALL